MCLKINFRPIVHQPRQSSIATTFLALLKPAAVTRLSWVVGGGCFEGRVQLYIAQAICEQAPIAKQSKPAPSSSANPFPCSAQTCSGHSTLLEVFLAVKYFYLFVVIMCGFCFENSGIFPNFEG